MSNGPCILNWLLSSCIIVQSTTFHLFGFFKRNVVNVVLCLQILTGRKCQMVLVNSDLAFHTVDCINRSTESSLLEEGLSGENILFVPFVGILIVLKMLLIQIFFDIQFPFSHYISST